MGQIHVFERVKNCGISLHLSSKLFLSSSFRLHHQFRKLKCGEWAGGECLSFSATRLDCFKGGKGKTLQERLPLGPVGSDDVKNAVDLLEVRGAGELQV